VCVQLRRRHATHDVPAEGLPLERNQEGGFTE
jgi:hypothetical protein